VSFFLALRAEAALFLGVAADFFSFLVPRFDDGVSLAASFFLGICNSLFGLTARSCSLRASISGMKNLAVLSSGFFPGETTANHAFAARRTLQASARRAKNEPATGEFPPGFFPCQDLLAFWYGFW
jgi:hypothetical protein